MFYNGKFYYKIDIHGPNGYTFMVYSSTEFDNTYDILKRCRILGYFDDDTDMNYAEIDELISVYDIEHFTKNNIAWNI